MKDLENLIYNDIDKILFEKLNILNYNLSKDTLDLETIFKQINNISKYNDEEKLLYVKSLLDPKNNRDCKIPSKIPISSCSFQLHCQKNIQTNNLGNLIFCLNPYFLADTNALNKTIYFKNRNIIGYGLTIRNFVSSFFLNNSNNMDGSGNVPGEWKAVNFDQTIPVLYGEYRLVSACLEIKYMGSIENARGSIGGAISFKENQYIGCEYQRNIEDVVLAQNPYLSTFSSINKIRDSFYFEDSHVTQGLKLLYFPVDNTSTNFQPVYTGQNTYLEIYNIDQINYINIFNSEPNTYKSEFKWVVYVKNGPVNDSNFQIDMYCNFECIPRYDKLNFLPMHINTCFISDSLKKKIFDFLKKNAVKKINNFSIS